MGVKLFYLLFALGGLAIIIASIRTGHFLKSLILTAVQGIAALFAVNFIGSFFGVHINLNPFSLIVSSVAGTAGVILLLLLNSLALKT
ncbi:MAG: SigmaK-factor processing regulatory BofA [Clostridiales bacterium]|jgi:inhibitor of the pro-sigma K processing machinery|nr:SigmaK-factor processing regulatory BofA [Clostridiales bacterium]HOJ35877.1 pro-sigmaK processing inhibitor BofA family protein [Clostridiales bacterium]HOL79622.1 pro-sigmaK processing inhibitor BofA family protein [Clostridiales bacterium]HPP69016.1 pro-sigmaK processing inhibitor BofA family protein [Clostridiales bacterium]HPU67055.1 pro-sigmaK processing inhibitor BofA family protein [Clostridiales bacterium]